MTGRSEELTRYLAMASAGDGSALNSAFALVYDELRQLASARLAALPPGNTLQATALVNEAYLKLALAPDQSWVGRAHFFGAAANAIRNILVDHVRRKQAVKRGGVRGRIELTDEPMTFDSDPEAVLAVDEALSRLRELDPDAARLVELRFFAGLTYDQIAEASGVSTRSVERRWRFARAWLAEQLNDVSNETDRES